MLAVSFFEKQHQTANILKKIREVAGNQGAKEGGKEEREGGVDEKVLRREGTIVFVLFFGPMVQQSAAVNTAIASKARVEYLALSALVLEVVGEEGEEEEEVGCVLLPSKA